MGVPSFVGRALGYIPCLAAGMPPRSLTQKNVVIVKFRQNRPVQGTVGMKVKK
ncbi:hypothetical protein SAMN04487911_1135 [Arenibacter nanhaiticus]|uniref:Uncharacterized protein n=1 Tax=Arenibacter nanhaiticus TaxID=558155 RepID=A0A1M6H5N9_9FLAO|nr:hypothetical protein SAMN04487911_1135 [Arenibacter nanhaiticus]